MKPDTGSSSMITTRWRQKWKNGNEGGKKTRAFRKKRILQQKKQKSQKVKKNKKYSKKRFPAFVRFTDCARLCFRTALLCLVVLQYSFPGLSCVTTWLFYAYVCFRTTLLCLVVLQYSFSVYIFVTPLPLLLLLLTLIRSVLYRLCYSTALQSLVVQKQGFSMLSCATVQLFRSLLCYYMVFLNLFVPQNNSSMLC